MMRFSAIRALGGARPAAAICKTYSAWSLKSRMPRTLRQNKHAPSASKRWPPSIGRMGKSYPSPIAFCTGWDLFPGRVQPPRRTAKARPSFFTSHAPALRRLHAPPPDRLRQARSCRARLRRAKFRPALCRRAKSRPLRQSRNSRRHKMPPFPPAGLPHRWPKSHPQHPGQNSPRGRTPAR